MTLYLSSGSFFRIWATHFSPIAPLEGMSFQSNAISATGSAIMRTLPMVSSISVIYCIVKYFSDTVRSSSKIAVWVSVSLLLPFALFM